MANRIPRTQKFHLPTVYFDYLLLLFNKALRACLPTFPYEKRISKIDTLRLAIAYLALLKDLLANMDSIVTNQPIRRGQLVIQFMIQRLNSSKRHHLSLQPLVDCIQP
ncbi:unnamed protein product [Trichobilharzia regenti]|nr:unnamed protein product [Trichobilharzia regenti]